MFCDSDVYYNLCFVKTGMNHCGPVRLVFPISQFIYECFMPLIESYVNQLYFAECTD